MSILIELLPALGWGLQPLAVSKIGGKPSNQILGTTVGALILGVAAYLITTPEMTNKVFLLSLLSGSMWVIGQLGQYISYGSIGVSRTMPISTGLQLIGTTLIGVLAFGEWSSGSQKAIGFTALALVIVGIYLTTIKDDKQDGSVDKKTLLILFLTNFGYLAYSTIPQVVDEGGPEVFFPQAIGMVIAAVLYALFSRQAGAFGAKITWKHLLSGLFFAVAALSYTLSAEQNGVATGFVLSQLSVVLSTLGGIFFLKEHKTRRELIYTIIGLVLIVLCSVVTGFLRS